MKKTKIAIVLLSGACVLTTATAIAGWCIAAGGGTEKLPPSISGVSKTISTNKAPDELTAENAVYAFLQKQSELESYEITTVGTVVANLLGYKQEVHNTTFKNGEDFLNQAASDSFLVSMKHQSFSKDGKVVYRNDFSGEMSVATKQEYKKIYGFTADEILLGGYIINPGTLRYANLEKTEGDVLTYYMRLTGDQSVANKTATESSTAYVGLQTQAYGSLDNVPEFSDVDIHLTVKKDWTPVSYTSSCSYECKKGVNMSIMQTLTCTYSKVNEAVEIPDVDEFNEKIGSEPSEIQPGAPSQDPLTQLATALGNTMEDGSSLSMPVSISLALSEKPLTLGGDLELKIDEDAFESGDLLNAFALRLDLDLSSVPLISAIADTLTVRYPGDGLLLLMLNDRSQGMDNILFTYSIDLSKTLSSTSAGLSSGDLVQTLVEYVEIEASDTGYAISLNFAILDKLNTYIGNFAKKAEEALKDTGGYVRSLLGMKFTDLKVELEGKEKIEKLALVLEGELPVIKIGVNLDVGILSQWDLLTGPITGDLQFRLDPAALLTGDYYAIAEAHLHLDLSSAVKLLAIVPELAPGSLPTWFNPELTDMDVYYTGDGMLTLALNNAESQPLLVTQINLKEQTALSDGTVSSLLSGLKLEITANGSLALDESSVTKINAAYQHLVQKAKDYVTASSSLGEFAAEGIGAYLGAEISQVEFFLGKNDEGETMFGLTIKGTTQQISEDSLLSLTLTLEGKHTDGEEESLAKIKETVEKLLAQYEENAKTAADHME